MTVLGSRVRACFLMAMDAAILASCRQAATPPPPSPPPTADAAPEAAAPHVEAPELPEDEWRVKIRTAGQPCEKDEVRGRFAEERGAGPCDRVGTYKGDTNTGAVLDPLADNAGKTCHYTYCEPLTVKRVAQPTCHSAMMAMSRGTYCITPPEQGSMLPAPAPYRKCPIGLEHQGPFDPTSTKANEDGECCYSVCLITAVVGRPFRTDGTSAVVAAARAGNAWLAPLGDWQPTPDLDAAERWLREAALEHASIATFARLSLELLAHGAPPELVTLTHAAALDEVAHARVCFALAHGYGATACAPRAQPAFAAPRATSLVDLAVETLLDGCIGETTAFLLLRAHADACDDLLQRKLLLTMAEDEARHAELGWAIVAWAVEQDPAVLRAVADAWQRHVAADGVSGWLAADVEQRICREALERVVRPCLDVLVA